VRQRPDGLLERIGRKDRQVKIRGARVDLEGVEAVLRQHPLVRDAAALARPRICQAAQMAR
jgi:acyl-coenzyme A synthetase/AMP-(fatty) acid ligase